MIRVAALAAGGIAAALTLMDLVPGADTSSSARWMNGGSAATGAQHVNRALKSDRAAPARPAAAASRHAIATVEVVGVKQPIVIYRDREGRELYRTDPVSNVTIVSKDVTIPRVTIRDRADSPTERLTVDTPAAQSRPPEGCDTLVSPIGAPPSVAGLVGRCVTAIEPLQQVADSRG